MSTGLQSRVSSSFKMQCKQRPLRPAPGTLGPMFTQWEEYGTFLSGPRPEAKETFHSARGSPALSTDSGFTSEGAILQAVNVWVCC